MNDLADLTRRVEALEAAQKHTAETQEWMASTLGRIAAVQDQHTQRFDRIETDLAGLRREFDGFRRDLPSIIADAVREGMKER